MGYFKNIVTDVLEDWDNGLSIGEIARKHNLSLREAIELISEYYIDIIDELKRALA